MNYSSSTHAHWHCAPISLCGWAACSAAVRSSTGAGVHVSLSAPAPFRHLLLARQDGAAARAWGARRGRHRHTVEVGGIARLGVESKRRPVAGRDVRAGDGDPIAGCLRAEPQLTVAVAVDFAHVVAAAMRRPVAVAIRRVRVAVVHSRIRTRNHLAVGVGRDAEVVGGMQLPRLDKDVVRQRVLLPGDGGDRLADLGEAAACAAGSLS